MHALITVGIVMAAILFVGLALFVYIRFIEPHRIAMVYRTIASPNVPKTAEGLRIAQISDLHVANDDLVNKLFNLTDAINRTKPDIIVFTGDLFDDFANYRYNYWEASIPMRMMEATHAKFAIYGNHDYAGISHDAFDVAMKESHFVVLKSQSLHHPELGITITGYDDAIYGQKADEFHPFEGNINGMRDFHVILVHEPDVAEIIDPESYDLMLSGHTHGGQIRIPWIKPIYKPSLGEHFQAGWYAPAGTQARGRLYVNRGIGCAMLPFRFNAPPELTVFTLKHADSIRTE